MKATDLGSALATDGCQTEAHTRTLPRPTPDACLRVMQIQHALHDAKPESAALKDKRVPVVHV